MGPPSPPIMLSIVSLTHYVLSTVAFEATHVQFRALFLQIKDPEIIACALHSIDIISNEVVEEVAFVPSSTEEDIQSFHSQVIPFPLMHTATIELVAYSYIS